MLDGPENIIPYVVERDPRGESVFYHGINE